jgi:hypothetical protein
VYEAIETVRFGTLSQRDTKAVPVSFGKHFDDSEAAREHDTISRALALADY